MNRSERITEWLYRFDERLGILCGSDNPTEAQVQIAFQEADDWWFTDKGS